jgi:hypothetical protein
MKKTAFLLPLLLVFAWISAAGAYESFTGPTGVLQWNTKKAYEGYTLFAPMINCKTTYLIDMEGNVVHTWKSKYPPGLYAELLPNGNLLRAATLPRKAKKGYCGIGGAGGLIEEIDWDGNVVWSYQLWKKNKEIQHHTFKRLPNGNTLILAFEVIDKQEGIDKGRDPATLPTKPVVQKGVPMDDWWIDFVREVNPAGDTVWEWRAWDHLGTGPDQLDINYKLPDPVGLTYPNWDWSHFNSIDYIPETDQIVLNSRNFAEFYFINHKTGKIEYRWGNPSAYGQGKAPSWYDNGDQKVFGTHCATVLENGNILLFDNGSERPEERRSAVVEVDPKKGEIVWEFSPKHTSSFFSYRQGAAQRLPNGNTFVTSTHGGHLFEVDKRGNVVWDYVSPIFNNKAQCLVTDDDAFDHKYHQNGQTNMIHRAYRYGADYPGLKGRDLTQKEPLVENCPPFYKTYQ